LQLTGELIAVNCSKLVISVPIINKYLTSFLQQDFSIPSESKSFNFFKYFEKDIKSGGSQASSEAGIIRSSFLIIASSFTRSGIIGFVFKLDSAGIAILYFLILSP